MVQPKDKVSVLNDVNFQLELIHRDTVNVGYILNLLQSVVNNKDPEKKKQYRAQVQDIISTNHSLYDKQELIQKFLDENIPRMANGQSVEEVFSAFWDVEKEKALDEKRAEMSHQVIQTDEWPLFDVRITKIEDQKHRIHISFDNIIFDGWSMFHLLNEWAEVYRNGKYDEVILYYSISSFTIKHC